ncbi:hypothetical protein ABBQ32_004114 [Trebouxia sp. C0010 RCD-2024]
MVKLTHVAEAAAPVAQDQLKEVCMSQMGMIKTAATLMTKILQTRDVPAHPKKETKEIQRQDSSRCQPTDPPDCITAMVQLLHHLLICKPAELDMTQACCLGVPILLRYLTSSSIHDRHSCELVKVVLDILAADPVFDDNPTSSEHNSLRLRTVSALLLHEATFQHLATKHSAQLLQYLADFDCHLDQPVVKDWPGHLPSSKKCMLDHSGKPSRM